MLFQSEAHQGDPMIYILDIAIKTYREAISFPKLVIQLGALYGKFVSCGGMTYSVFIKLYESSVESILFYGSGIWGTKQHSVINNVQNKAGKLFLAVGNRLLT